MATLIEATLGHCTEAHSNRDKTGEDDIHYFLDFDMAVLGSSSEGVKHCYCAIFSRKNFVLFIIFTNNFRNLQTT